MPIPPPERTRQRSPALFAPSQHQLDRLHALLSSDDAVGQVLAAVMDYGVPIGPLKPSVTARQTARHARAIARALTALDDLIRANSPAWAALVERAAASASADSDSLRLVRALGSDALPALVDDAQALASSTPAQRGRPADADRKARLQLVRRLAAIAEANGVRVARLAPDFCELLEIVFDLAYITGTSTDTAIRDLLDDRAPPPEPRGTIHRLT